MGCVLCNAARRARCSTDAPGRRDGSELTTVTLDRESPSGVFGARVVDTETKAGLMIVRIPRGGALSRWNEINPSTAVATGDSIVEVNGLTAPWAIMEEMANAVTVKMVVLRRPPGAAAILARCTVTDKSLKTTALVLKRTVRAGDVSMDSCAICMEDVAADERVAGLDCGHGFHQRCIMRWLARQGAPGCPLCRGAVDDHPLSPTRCDDCVPTVMVPA